MKTAMYCQIGAQAPELIRLLPLGEVVLGDGRQPFQVTQESLEKIMEAWNLRGNDMVIDYEHQTVTGQAAPAAGWVKGLSPANDGLWARVVWTDRAREYIEKREYRYFSPVVQLGEGREVVDLLHVALTNFPAMSNLDPLILQHQGLGDSEPEAGRRREGKREEGRGGLKGGESIEIRGENMIIEDLRLIFGLQNDVSEDQILATATDLVKIKEQQHYGLPKEIVRSLGLEEDDSAAEVLQRIESLKAEAGDAGALREENSQVKERTIVSKRRAINSGSIE